jgi:hypothetical protein
MVKVVPLAYTESVRPNSAIQEGGEDAATENKPILVEATKEDVNTPMTA